MVLDTNQLLGKSPDGVVLRMVQKVAAQTGHDLVLPEVVVEEYLAHYQHEIGQAVKRIRDGIDDLHRLIPSWTGETAFLRSVETLAEKTCRDKLGQLFRIHPTPNGAWREALFREAHRRPPAKTSWERGKPGSGARDVAIWLTTLDACLGSQEETYFVTTNSSDFGKGGSLRSELAQELHDRLGQDALFHYCSDIRDLMSQLGIEAASPPDDDMIGSAAAVQAAVETALADDQVEFEFVAGIPNLAMKFAGAFEGVQGLRFSGRKDKVEAYRIGGDIWACARGAWEGWNECSVFWRPELMPVAPGS